MERILFIRGGAIGDLVLTLPAVALVRQRWPRARVDILGYPAIAEIGHGRGFFDAVRSMDHHGLSAFFIRDNILDPAWMDYFGTFDLVVSYLFDPDGLFLGNLEKCNPGKIVTVSPKVKEGRPAAHHLAAPLGELGLAIPAAPTARLAPTAKDKAQAQAFLREGEIVSPSGRCRLLLAHPGSGSASKNWPDDCWREALGAWLKADAERQAVLLGGEAEGDRLGALKARLPEPSRARVTLAENLPLPVVAALLARADVFLGHDSGISHLAAAVGAPGVLLFGPTNPATWAPVSDRLRVLKSANGTMEAISVQEVLAALENAI